MAFTLLGKYALDCTSYLNQQGYYSTNIGTEASEVFTAKLEAKTWKKIINALVAIIDKASIEVTKEGLKFTAMDPSHICMVDFSMEKEQFEEYEIKEAENLTMGIDVGEMRKLINRSKPDETLTLIADEAQITMKLQQKDSETVRRFRIPQIDVLGDEKYVVPHLDTTAQVRLPSYMFDDAIKDVYLVSNNVTFHCTRPIFIVSGEGDSGSVQTEIKEWLEYDVREECKCSFNLSYLTDLSKTIEDEVILDLGTDMPMKISFVLGGAEFQFVLAPRVERE